MFRIRCVAIRFNSDSKRRMISEDAEKNQLMIVYGMPYLVMPEQDRPGRFAANEALIAPDRDKTTVIAPDCLGKPIGILASFADSVDKRSGEYVVVLHPANRLPV